MAQGKKIVFAGASVKFAVPLFKDLAISRGHEASTVVVLDPDEERTALVTGVMRRVAEQASSSLKAEATASAPKALDGADFVVALFRVGGDEAWDHDLRISLQHGVSHATGDSAGPAALSRALRTVPAMVRLARDMEKRCPNAWLLNYALPVPAVTGAALATAGIRAAGLCRGAEEVRDLIATAFGADAAKTQVLSGGVCRFSWVVSAHVNGRDVTGEMLPALKVYRERVLAEKARSQGEKRLAMLTDGEDERLRVGLQYRLAVDLLEIFGCLPAYADPHTAESLPYFYRASHKHGQTYGLRPCLTGLPEPPRDRIMRSMQRWASGEAPIPNLTTPSGEAAEALIAAIQEDRRSFFPALSLPNDGYLPQLPSGAIVEAPAVAGAFGITGLRLPRFSTAVGSLIERVAAIQELTLRAALEGDRSLALRALMLEPMVRDVENAGKLLDDLLAAQTRWLPQFRGPRRARASAS